MLDDPPGPPLLNDLTVANLGGSPWMVSDTRLRGELLRESCCALATNRLVPADFAGHPARLRAVGGFSAQVRPVCRVGVIATQRKQPARKAPTCLQ